MVVSEMALDFFTRKNKTIALMHHDFHGFLESEKLYVEIIA